MQALPVPSSAKLSQPTSVDSSAIGDGTIADPQSFQVILATQVEATLAQGLGEELTEVQGDAIKSRPKAKSLIEQISVDPGALVGTLGVATVVSPEISAKVVYLASSSEARTNALTEGDVARTSLLALSSAPSVPMEAPNRLEIASSMDESADAGKLLPVATDVASESIHKYEARDQAQVEELTSAHAWTSGEASRPHSAVHAAPSQGPDPRHLREPLNSPAWGEGLGQRVVWMVKENVQVAHLQVEPPHLGPVEVQLTVDNDQTHVVFVSAHGAVRDAISNSLSKLDDLFNASGVSLGSVSVSTQSQAQHHTHPEQSRRDSSADDSPGAAEERTAPILPLSSRAIRGLVDLFA
jgi:flagellar hook-length control protein FliK